MSTFGIFAIDFLNFSLVSVRFFLRKKNSDSVSNMFGYVRFKNAVWFAYDSYLLLMKYSVTANSTVTVDDMTLTSLTTCT